MIVATAAVTFVLWLILLAFAAPLDNLVAAGQMASIERQTIKTEARGKMWPILLNLG
jgi:hypothetical protein